jgi:hypothetical protein
MTPFSGSYEAQDVSFLLKRVEMDGLSVADKERHIQSQGGHYSEVLTMESAPSADYIDLYQRTLDRNRTRFARHILLLAERIAQDKQGDITIVSLARAGTPVGVLLTRILNKRLLRKATHYCVSIIRDRGLDTNALRYILGSHSPESVVFVDGWTGKGVIGRELAQSVSAFNSEHNCAVSSALYVVADISGTASYAATREDYLLPSAILNSTISGLVSRTVLNGLIGPDDWHGCVYYEHLLPHDLSRAFVDDIEGAVMALSGKPEPESATVPVDGVALASTIQRYLAEYDLPHVNFIKPGVGEATRVLLRRAPRTLVLQQATSADTEHLRYLAHTRNIPVLVDAGLPCQAMALIDTAD